MTHLLRCMLLVLGVLHLLAVPAKAEGLALPPPLPPLAQVYLPQLHATQVRLWPDSPTPHFLAGQVELETCLSLSHPKCWSPRAELRTAREYGFGFGQITVAYRPDGSVRFNKFDELRREHAALRGWQWGDRFNPGLQLTAKVLMMQRLYGSQRGAQDEREQYTFALVAYNGGQGGLLQDRLLCRNTSGCDAARWWGNTELHSTKSRKALAGYGGRSPYSISRAYPRDIELKAARYLGAWQVLDEALALPYLGDKHSDSQGHRLNHHQPAKPAQ
jgi:hypothetical protein